MLSKSSAKPRQPRRQRIARGRIANVRYGIIVFPGSNGDADMYHVVRDVLGAEVEYIWHRDVAVDHVDCLILPGGASYGDALRPGALARFAPIMQAVKMF